MIFKSNTRTSNEDILFIMNNNNDKDKDKNNNMNNNCTVMMTRTKIIIMSVAHGLVEKLSRACSLLWISQ